MVPNLPDLRIIPLDLLVPHEQHDAQRSLPLAERLRAEAILRNPPVVAPLGGDDPRFVILDGANRHAAAAAIGLPHLLVQVVDYDDPELKLETWYHVVIACPQETLTGTLDAVPGLVRAPATLLHARAVLARRETLAYVVYPGNQVDLLNVAGDLRARTGALNAIVDGYKGCARLARTTTDQVQAVRRLYEDVTAVVVFPNYQPAEIVELARDAVRLPAGITRHVIPWRALRVNYPLEKLAEDRPLAEKTAALQAWLQRKLVDKQIRHYAESSVLFDE